MGYYVTMLLWVPDRVMIQDIGCRIQWDLLECVVVIVVVSTGTSLEVVVCELEGEFFLLELPCCVHLLL